VILIEPSDQLSHKRLRQLVASSLPPLARFRSRLVGKPLGMGKPLWAQIGDAAAHVSEYALTIGMAGVGLTLSVTELPRLGLRPFAVAAGAALAVVCASWLLTTAWRP